MEIFSKVQAKTQTQNLSPILDQSLYLNVAS